MKTTQSLTSLAVLFTPAVLAQATGTSAPTAPAPSCTASLITTLCDYPQPPVAVAEYRNTCWDYCNAHQPCNFAIFKSHPGTDSGTCWLYPGETFDASKGSKTCTSGDSQSLEVYDKPVCTDACAATATPTAVAEVCGYAPPETCFDNTCTASIGAADCVSQCAQAESCTYAVFNPHDTGNPLNADGTCCMYQNGTFDATRTTPCTGAPQQYVYNNVCPQKASGSAPVSVRRLRASRGMLL